MESKAIDYDQIIEGKIVVYRLRATQFPTNPEEEWRGRVTKVYGNVVAMVEILNVGFEGEKEPIFFTQIARIEP